MSKTRFTQWVVLACISGLAACTSGEGGTAGNTELNVIVPQNESSPGVPAPIDIGTVEYTINCLGNSDTFLDNGASFPDEVQINGNLEVVDGRTDPQGAIPPEFGTPRPGDGAEIWQGFMDLPPGPCTVQLRARDNDGEVICTATEPFSITADTISKVNLVLICDISFQAPVGMLDVDGTFSFNVGNFCPDLFQLNCVESNPSSPGPGLPPTTYCETRFRDGDSTCGAGCDPQSCVVTPEGLTCSPAPAPAAGVTTTVTCDQLLDCEGDLIPDASCVFSGDTLGSVGSGVPVPVLFGGPGPDAGGFYTGCAVDPGTGLLVTPGAPINCTAVTTDGDIDCDKTKVVTYNCPGLNFCDTTVCDDGNSCTDDSCDRVAGACVFTDSAAGLACDDFLPQPGECDGAGACVPQGCAVDADCPGPTDCTAQAVCNLGTFTCDPAAPANEGGACSTGTGSDIGVCTAGACVSSDACLVAADCDDTNDCTADVCSGAPLACSNPAEPLGTSCDPGTGNPGECDGAGLCVEQAPVFISAGTGSTTWFAPTTPPGGGTAPTTGGCSVFVTVLNTTIFLDVFIQLDVASDGANNIQTDWTVNAANPLLGALGAAAELGELVINASATNTTGGPIPSGLDPSAVGQTVGSFYLGPSGPLEIASPADITPGVATLTPTVGVPGTVNVNWDGVFSLRLDLAGNPLVVVDESVCAFSGPGTGVDFPTTN